MIMILFYISILVAVYCALFNEKWRSRHACVADPCCWEKEESGYRYYILPEQPIDRPNGTHIRQVEVNGEMEYDWQGDFIEVFVPFKGDTIYVKDGWAR